MIFFIIFTYILIIFYSYNKILSLNFALNI